MANQHQHQHRRSNSIPIVRFSQPLPPLPLDDLQPRNLPRITIIPYHDDPSEEEEARLLLEPSPTSPQPPCYEPMYDYLRAQNRPMNLTTPPPPPPQRIRIPLTLEPRSPYRDEPFVITIEHELSQPPPPSYEELYLEDHNRRQLQTLETEFDVNSNTAEEICKFIAAMLLVVLTIAAVGTAFSWGRARCHGAQC